MSISRPVRRLKPLLSSLNCDGKYGLALLGTCIALLAFETLGDTGRALLRYDRAGLAAGQWWRLLTGHLIHLDLEHAALNALGLVMMWALFARDYSPRQWLLIVLVSIAAIDAGLWLRDPDVLWYVGSSGLLHGVMAAGTIAHLRRGDLDGWILAAFMLAKLGYEQFTGALPFEHGSAPVVTNAHLYGAAAGLVAG